jgi:hypothetical protein
MYEDFDYNFLGDEDNSIELTHRGVVLKTISGEKAELFEKAMIRTFDKINPHLVNRRWVELDEPQHIIREYVGDAYRAEE